MYSDEETLGNCRMREYVSRTRFVDHKAHFVWKISGFTTRCPSRHEECLTSPKFRIPNDQSDWYLVLYPKGEEDENFVSLYLNSTRPSEVFVICEMALIGVSGKKVEETTFSEMFFEANGFPEFISRSELLAQKDELLPGDELTVSCTVTKRLTTNQTAAIKFDDDLPPGSRRLNSLNDDLAKYLEAKKGPDVVLKAGSEEIPAHKIILMCRSPVFESMFTHDTLENASKEVIITDVEFDVLDELVRFMHTDVASFKNADFALKLLTAADKYDVQPLKARCSAYLSANLWKGNVFRALKVANSANEAELVQNCISVIECEMSSVGSLAGWMAKLNACPGVLNVIERLLKDHYNSGDS